VGVPRKYKTILDKALDADRTLGLSHFEAEIKNIVNGNIFSSIPPQDRALLLKLLAKIEAYTNADLEKVNLILNLSLKNQEEFISKLRHERYALYKPRRRRPTKKETELSQEIYEAETELYITQLFRAQIILLEGKAGSISHCRNILIQVLNSIIAEFGLELEKKEKKGKDKEYFRKYINIIKTIMENFKDRPWKNQYVFAYCLYVYALTYRYAPVSENTTSFDLGMQEFQNCISSIEARTHDTAPKWISELFHESWAWELVQISRRGNYAEASKELLMLQSNTPYWSVYLRAMVQYCFIQAFKLDKLEEANDCLDRLKVYDMMPDLKFLWLLTKVYCQKKLAKQSDEDYRENIIHLNNLIFKYRNYPNTQNKSLQISLFHHEIKQLQEF